MFFIANVFAKQKTQNGQDFQIPSADNCKYEDVPKELQSTSLSTRSHESTNQNAASPDFNFNWTTGL